LLDYCADCGLDCATAYAVASFPVFIVLHSVAVFLIILNDCISFLNNGAPPAQGLRPDCQDDSFNLAFEQLCFALGCPLLFIFA